MYQASITAIAVPGIRQVVSPLKKRGQENGCKSLLILSALVGLLITHGAEILNCTACHSYQCCEEEYSVENVKLYV